MRREELILACGLVAAPAGLPAQSIAARVAAAPDAEVQFSFAARPGVCGDGRSVIRNGKHGMWISKHSFSTYDDDRDPCPCDAGPVRVTLTVRRHRVTEVETQVGGKGGLGRDDLDLGLVSTASAVRYLIDLAESNPDAGANAVFPAVLADSVVVWPDLLRLARKTELPRDTRNQAIFWVGQAAGEAATRGLDSLATDAKGDRDIRSQAVFALSQRPQSEGVPILIRLARTDRDPEIRRDALFWLGQSNDPRALDLFEELLVRR
jgi:hypothetical protein